MAIENNRTHFWHYVLDSEGRPIQNAEIRLYLNDYPTIEATIFLAETSGTYTTCSVADIKTDNDGFFEFWLANEWESGGHSLKQTFILEWYKAGTAPGMIKNVNPWPNVFAWEDKNTGADRYDRNKFVSDYLANKWLTHTQQIVPSASPHDLHPVDLTNGCIGSDNRYNKVVSNKLVYDIIALSNAESSETIPHRGISEHQEDITSWSTSSGIYYKDIPHQMMNKNVTVQLSKLSDLEVIEPKRITNLSTTLTRIFMDSSVNVRVNVQGSLSSSSSSSTSSSSSVSSSSSSFSSSSSESSSSSSKTVDDDFTGTNGDSPDSEKWTEQATNHQFDIQSNQLYTSLDRDIGDTAARMLSNWVFDGGTNFNLYFDLPTFTWNNGNANIAMLRVIDSSNDEVSIGRDVYASADWFRCRSYISASSVNRGNVAPGVNYPNGMLRLRRIGSTWEAFIYNETTLGWDQYAIFTWASTLAFRVTIETYTTATGDDLTVTWDNFTVVGGTFTWD